MEFIGSGPALRERALAACARFVQSDLFLPLLLPNPHTAKGTPYTGSLNVLSENY